MTEREAGRPGLRFEREIRNLVLLALLFLLFLSGATLIVLRNVGDWGGREFLERVGAAARSVAERLPPGADADALLASDAATAERLRAAGGRFAALYDAEGRRVADAPFLPDAALAPQELGPELRPARDASLTGDLSAASPPQAIVAASVGGGARILAMGFDGAPLAAARRNVRVLTAVVPAAALVVVLLAIPFLKRLTRPIEALAETARDAGTVVPPAAAGSGGRDEAAEAIETFARTVEALKKRSRELEELRRQEQERADALAVTAETLVRSHPGGLLVVDSESRLTDANGPAIEALQLSEVGLGCPAADALRPFPTLIEAVERAAGGTPTLAKEFAAGEAGGGRLLAVTAVPVVDSAGRPLGTLVFLEDRTTTSRLERELSARREFAALGEMSAGIAHEFRNATATILGYARLAATTEDPGARARHLHGIRTEAEHVARVTGDFLFFARPERLAVTPTPLGPLVEEAVAEERVAAPGARFEIAGTFASAAVDPALLRRALVNLLRNAREAAATEGRAGRIVVRGEGVLDGAARIAVEDDGPGVPVDALPKLFVPFYSTKESGTGLGLALVAKIATLHGGSVLVERSEALPGARFVLCLPVPG